MPHHALTLHATHTKWDEDRSITTTPRLTPAHVAFDLSSPSSAPIKGTIETEYLMTYLPEGNASFIFSERVSIAGLAGGKAGSFYSQGKGFFDGKVHKVTGEFSVVEGTGMGGLEGVNGKGKYGPAEGGKAGVLEYNFELEGVDGV